MYSIEYSNRYKKSYKLAVKRGLDVNILNNVVKTLAEGKKLDKQYKDHGLTGDLKGFRECHIQSDWLLIYQIIDGTCVLYLLDTGTHADLFGK
jgi:mRNA interferase YafQ